MRELTCIVCPIGCSLLVEEDAENGAVSEKDEKKCSVPQERSVPQEGFPALTVTGNRCPRGALYAREEIRAPKRVVTATCGIAVPAGGDSERDRALHGLTAPRRVPVKTSAACPREKIPDLLKDIYRLKLDLPVKAGDRALVNWQGTGIDVVVVRSLE